MQSIHDPQMRVRLMLLTTAAVLLGWVVCCCVLLAGARGAWVLGVELQEITEIGSS